MAVAKSPSDSESSGNEEWERLREAVWDVAPQQVAPCLESSDGNISKSKLPSDVSSIRRKVSDHGQNQNELQTTPEFRAHVAKKLRSILDSSITLSEPMLGCVQTCTKASEADDDSFRLFSSSIPGASEKAEPSLLPRKQPQRSSSSETDEDQEWQRCQEAAVSAADILKRSGLQASFLELTNDHTCQTTESQQKKKKKRKKKTKVKEESDSEKVIIEKPHKNKVSVWTEKPSYLNGAHERESHVTTEDSGLSKEVMVIKKKKKKRKKMEART